MVMSGWISMGCERAAFTLAEYVLGEEFQSEWAIGTGYLPVNLKARQSEPYQAFVQQEPVVRVFLEQAEYGRSSQFYWGKALPRKHLRKPNSV